MKIKRYYAKDMRTALAQVKEELGVDAVIMSNKKTATGIELVAAVDSDAEATNPSTISSTQPANETQTAPPSIAANQSVNNQQMANASGSIQALMNRPEQNQMNQQPATNVASSLDELLKRQTNFSHNTQSVSSATARQQPVQALQQNENPVGTMTQALSQQAESEFEQWLSKARDKVVDEPAPSQVDFNSLNKDMGYDTNSNTAEQTNLDGDDLSDPISTPISASISELATLKAEMSSIKQLLEHQVSNLMWQDVNRRQPVKAMLTSKLKEMGLSVKVAEHLTHFIGEDTKHTDVWPKMLALLTEQLDTTDNEIIKRGGVYALVGPTGVGKTTTIAKLAARYAQMYGADKVGLITTDSFRIGALEQLATYAKILGCPLKQAKDVEELSEAIYQLRNKKLVLIDTAGMSQRDIKLTERLNYLLTRSRVNIKNYLVLSATSQMSVLQESVQHFKTIPLSGCIFTKIDESLSLGELMSVAIHNRLPIGYLTNGQRVPEDIRVANSGKIVQKANQLFELKQKVTNENNKVVPKAVGMYD